MSTTNTYFAQAYSAGDYGASTYQNGSTTTSSTTTSGTSSSKGILTNTGFDLILIATIACALMFAALIARFYKRPRKNQSKSGSPS